jgi:hypothetical protein
MPVDIDPIVIETIGTSAGAGGLVGAVIAFFSKYLLDQKFEKHGAEMSSIKIKLAEDYLNKKDTLEIIKEMKREFEMLANKFDQANATLVKIEYALTREGK